jgi:hypothetical protein
VEPFQGVGDEQVEAPAARLGETGQERLADEFVGEEQPVLTRGV